MKKKKAFFIANSPDFLKIYLLKHIDFLSRKFELYVCCKNANQLKGFVSNDTILISINFERGLSFLNDVRSFFKILSFFLKIKPNLSISFTPKVGLVVAIAAFITRVPKRIHWFTGQVWVWENGLKKFLLKLSDRLIYILCSSVLVDSQSQKKFLIIEKVISNNKSTVLHKGSIGGVDMKKFKFNKKIRIKLRKLFLISHNTYVFLFLGRVNKDKGLPELIKAFKLIQQAHDVKLIIVGPIEDITLKNLFKNNEKILYFNFTRHPEKWFSLSDTLCLPSHREGFGTVIIEAASCGIPTICSKIYGLSDSVIHKKTGLFHKVGSVSDIKKKMIYMINNKRLIKKYGESAKKRVKKDFDQHLIIKEFKKFINNLIL